MTNSTPICLNCGASLQGKFCHDCGQKVIEPNERTVRHFLIQFLGSAFFLENNFVKNLWILLTKPGLLTADFIEGKRKRWMPPLSIFLLINLFYFWFSPLTDLNLRLSEQLMQPQHAQLAHYMVDTKLKTETISRDELEDRYNKKSSTFANTLIIIHIPIFAVFMALLFARKRFLYTDHFIYALHFFSVALIIGLVQSGLVYLFAWLDILNPSLWPFISLLFLIFILIYAFLSVKRVYQQKAVLALILIVPILFFFIVAHFIYRTILFLITFSLV
jgi:hypothetical protein